MSKKMRAFTVLALVFLMLLSAVAVSAEEDAAVAQVGETKYETLAEAIAGAQAGDTVVLLNNVDLGDSYVRIDKSITIDGGEDGHAIVSAGKWAVYLKGDAELDVTLKNLSVQSTHYPVDAGSCVALTVENCTVQGWCAVCLAAGSDQSVLTVINSDLIGVNTWPDNADHSNHYGTIAVESNDVTILVDADSSITYKAENTAAQYPMIFYTWDAIYTYKATLPADEALVAELKTGGYCVADNGDGTVMVDEHNKTVKEYAAVEPTCTEDGCIAHKSCACGAVVTDLNGNAIEGGLEAVKLAAAGHELTKVDANPATKEAEGNIEYYVCEECGKYYSDSEGTVEITDRTSVVIGKLQDSGNPETGDAAVLAPAAVLLALSAAAVAVANKKRFA